MEPEGLEQPPTKKRARNVATTSDAPSSKSKKQRGRPKVDTQDETAADVSNQKSHFAAVPHRSVIMEHSLGVVVQWVCRLRRFSLVV